MPKSSKSRIVIVFSLGLCLSASLAWAWTKEDNPIVEFLIDYGQKLYHRGDVAGAVHEMSKALLVDPDNKKARQYLEEMGFPDGLYTGKTAMERNRSLQNDMQKLREESKHMESTAQTLVRAKARVEKDLADQEKENAELRKIVGELREGLVKNAQPQTPLGAPPSPAVPMGSSETPAEKQSLNAVKSLLRGLPVPGKEQTVSPKTSSTLGPTQGPKQSKPVSRPAIASSEPPVIKQAKSLTVPPSPKKIPMDQLVLLKGREAEVENLKDRLQQAQYQIQHREAKHRKEIALLSDELVKVKNDSYQESLDGRWQIQKFQQRLEENLKDLKKLSDDLLLNRLELAKRQKELEDKKEAVRELREAIEQQRIRMRDKERQVSSLDHDLSSVAADLSLMTDSIKKRDARLESLRKELVESTQLLDNKQGEVTSLGQVVSGLREKISSQESTFKQKEAEFVQVKAQLAQMEQHIAETEQKLKDKEDALADLNQELSGLKTELTQARQSAEEKAGEVAKLDQKLGETKQGLLEKDMALERRTQQGDAMKEELAQAKKSAQEKSDRVAELDHKVAASEKELSEQQEALTQRTQELGGMKTELAQAKKTADQMDFQLKSLNSQVTDYQNQLSDLKEQLQGQQQEIETKGQLIHDLETESSNLKKEMDSLKAKLTHQNEQLQQKDSNLQLLQKEIGDLKTMALTKSERLQAAQADQDKNLDQLKTTQAQIKELKDRLQEQESLFKKKTEDLADQTKELDRLKDRLASQEKAAEKSLTKTSKGKAKETMQTGEAKNANPCEEEIGLLKKKDTCIQGLKTDLASTRKALLQIRMDRQTNSALDDVMKKEFEEARNKMLEQDVVLEEHQQEIAQLKSQITDLEERLGLSQRLLQEKEASLKQMAQQLREAEAKCSK